MDTVLNNYHTFRNSFRLSFRWTPVKNIVLEGTNYLQNSLSNRQDYIITSNLALSFVIYKWLSLSSVFIFNRFNRTNQQNLLLTYGLKVDRTFIQSKSAGIKHTTVF